ncbi:MAG: O-antigen ligase family protein [Desulfobulbaceae bacterium]
MIVLFFFAATQVSIFISPKIADVGRWVGMAVALFLGHVWGKKNGHRFSLIKGGVDVLIWGLLFAFSLSALDSVAKEKSFLYLAVCLLQIVLFTFMSRRLSLESWRLLFGSLVALCVVVSFMGLGGYLRSPDLYIVQGRLAGLGNANSVGLIAMIGAIISLAKFLFAEVQDMPNRKRWKIFYFFGGIGCLISLVLSGSRGSLGGMLSGILVVLFFTSRTSRLILGLLALIPLMPFLNLFVETELKQRVASAYVRAGGNDILYTRRYVWDQAIHYFKENPWLGKGYAVHDTFGMVLDGSGYHGLLASVGVVGILMFISVAVWILVRLFRRGMMLTKQKSYLPGNRELLALGGGCLVALLVQGVGEPWMLGPGSLMHVVFWLSAGACIAGIMFQQVSRSESGGRRAGVGRQMTEDR